MSIEDEPVIAARLKRFTNIFFTDYELIWIHLDNLASAHQTLVDTRVDIILLDLNIYGEDGFEVLKRAVSYAAQTIVVSAYVERAMEAFELGVVDFVGKPFNQQRLFKAFERAISDKVTTEKSLKYLSFRAGMTTEIVKVEDILFIKGADKYVDIVTQDGDVKFHDKSLGALCKILPDYFVRIHKSFIVPMTCVLAVNSRQGSRYYLTLCNGTQLPVGRTRIDRVRSLLKAYI